MTVQMYSGKSTKLQNSARCFFFSPVKKKKIIHRYEMILKFDPIYSNVLDIKSFENCFRVGAAHTFFPT